jgi:ketosteroid isomerase-like protein
MGVLLEPIRDSVVGEPTVRVQGTWRGKRAILMFVSCLQHLSHIQEVTVKLRLPLRPILLAAVATACTTPAPTVDLAAESQAVRQRDMDFSKAASDGDMAAIDAFYTTDAMFMMDNEPSAVGAQAVHGAFSQMLAMPGFGVSWVPDHVEVSQSGDMAVSTGHYTMQLQGPTGPMEDKGKYLTVWKKVDGTWLVSHDIANSDMPMPETPAGGEMMKH